MNKSVAHSIFLFVEQLGVALWIGAIVMFAFAVAGTVFKEAGSINLAGRLNGAILARLNWLEAFASALMTTSAIYFLLQASERTTTRFVKVAILLAMIALLVVYGKFLTERMEFLRAEAIKDFDNFDPSKQAFRDEFNALHKTYSRLVSLNLFLGVAFLAISAFERK
ncbi:MAG: hypothetical protein NZM06_02755 [Chloroherpetonaceae bacterium]|nr:hypothetical protein [Chloroherpetonaceae bacterium]MDW8436884.1 hypothetical protein [Chloroherpetonaceae bacterium]